MNIHNIIRAYGYWGIFGTLCAEFLGIPFPGETILTVAGFEWSNGTFNFMLLLLSTVFGTFAGSFIAYVIGRYLGRPVILRFGKYVGVTKERMDVADDKFQKFTVPLLIFSRFVAGVRILTPYLAGINRTPVIPYALYTLLGSVLWSVSFLLIGRFLGHEWTRYQHVIHRMIIPLIFIASILIIGFWLLKKRKKRKPA